MEGGRAHKGDGGIAPKDDNEGGRAGAPGLWYGEYLLACNYQIHYGDHVKIILNWSGKLVKQ